MTQDSPTLKSRKEKRWPIMLIVALAFVLRVAAALVHPVVDRAAYPDAGDYHDLAVSMKHGGEYKVGGGIAVRMPGYPLLIAAVYTVAGDRPINMLMAQAAMGAATCGLMHCLGRRVSDCAGLIAAALAAVDPLSVAMSAALLSETPFTLALVAMVWLAVRLGELSDATRGIWVRWAAMGLAAGAAVYLRASSLYLPWLLAAALLAARFSWRRAGGALLAVAVMAAMLLPWKVWLTQHAETAGLQGLTSLEGISLYEAVYSGADGGPRQGELLRHPPAEISGLTEAQRDSYWRAQAWREMKDNPWRMLALAGTKVQRTWTPGVNADELRNPVTNAALWAWHVPLFLLALAGVLMRGVPASLRWPVVLPLVYFTAIHSLFLGSVRYRVPLQPLLCMLAAAGACAIAGALIRQRNAAPRV